MGLEGKRIAILIEDDYQMHEFWYPFYRMQEAGAEVRVVGTGRDSYASHGYAVKPDLQATEAKVDDFDAVIIPGGQAPDKMRRSREMVAFVHDMDAAGKPVAAICHAGSMLVSARMLRGRNATSFYSVRDDLEAAGANWSDEPVVVDGNLITSRVPGDLPAFCRAVISTLSKAPAAVG
ncbi:MAG TPA: type 1 glutamine amidotransferase domain-containing protein [Candidatus Dormibacteraeota bacterium]|jgi:protease I